MTHRDDLVTDPNNENCDISGGLAKREYFAALNAASIIGRWHELPPESRIKQLNDWKEMYGEKTLVKDAVAMDAVAVADSLITALNKTP